MQTNDFVIIKEPKYVPGVGKIKSMLDDGKVIVEMTVVLNQEDLEVIS